VGVLGSAVVHGLVIALAWVSASVTPAPAASTASGSTGTAKAVPGPNPVASSAGGAGLNVRTQGATFVDQAYLVNIVYRVKRYFRRPETARTDRAEVCFRIEREGTASDIRIAGASGSAAFKLAVMEAVEQAGNNREFGRLPAAYTADFLPVCLEIQPDQ
jgi:outer membrane biosynthesis protein TonB